MYSSIITWTSLSFSLQQCSGSDKIRGARHVAQQKEHPRCRLLGAADCVVTCYYLHHCPAWQLPLIVASFITYPTTISTMSADEVCASSPTSWTFYVALVLALPTLVYVVGYLIPQIYMCVRPIPDLKTKYAAEWALVTGSGSGIGRALAFTLAGQGLNVVLVSLDDAMLKQTVKDLQTAFPKLQFKAVGVSFSPGVDYMKKIREATKDLDVPIIFNNAGFMVRSIPTD
eukprot:scaffold1695_cov167-Amphora_coffeaeformis.AAC.10